MARPKKTQAPSLISEERLEELLSENHLCTFMVMTKSGEVWMLGSTPVQALVDLIEAEVLAQIQARQEATPLA